MKKIWTNNTENLKFYPIALQVLSACKTCITADEKKLLRPLHAGRWAHVTLKSFSSQCNANESAKRAVCKKLTSLS